MPDFYIRAEPIFSEESVEQYRKRICNKQAAELASEKRIWERKKLAEISEARSEQTDILHCMNKYTPSFDALMALVNFKELCRSKTKVTTTVKQPTVMKNETITIEAPEGHVIDKENSTDTVIRFKKVEPNKRPMSWEDIESINGAYVADNSTIGYISNYRSIPKVKNVWTTHRLALAALALSQLLQLRDALNECNTEEHEGIPVWYGITNQRGKAVGLGSDYLNMPLRFETEETRDAFLKQFRPLIETALPLL